MKTKLFIAIGVIVGLSSCSNDSPKTESANTLDTSYMYFGDTITNIGAINASELTNLMHIQDSLKVKLTANIEEVCQNKGCWMNINLGTDKSMKVKFKDYAFFVPKDSKGKEVIMEGIAFRDTISVDELRHYAEDAGKSKKEIQEIVAPEVNIGFEASGVIIKK